ncbi:glycosyltransferase [Flammeovirga kamogawensis]|uniref:Glycosyltransferase n=1 Tax=Flammeovirga kamogawensis TaxID=373891 RepID=A0ABX8GV09_9BACT|nr:glycosyltransferase [Flammeovirga kamogawensis]MBB6459885.1 glycosyltransferase involved in cell wall biosynthesis [Flammeovirga kamogawensis]QWG07062.1 glycosyltransferase [Flammeovirga kamogawensis]TRX68883.1 glycosyltransferase [Flammeovirga kamogawensis]
MKIAILSTFYPLRGGIATYGAALLSALEKEGHVVKAFTFSRQYPDFLFPGKSQYITEEDNVEKIASEEVLDSINPITYYTTAKKIKAFKPDVLITQFWMSFFGPSVGTVAKLLKKDCITLSILHNVIPHEGRFFDKPFTKYYLNQHHCFVTMSDVVEKDLRSYESEKPSLVRAHPLYNHFGDPQNQEEAQLKLGVESDKKTLLFFGFIREYKGLDILIKTFDQLDDSYQLLIAGEVYGSFDSYMQLIQENRNKERIHIFNQYISDQEVGDYFSVADVCVLPYKSATQSGITSIALHFEVPLIATDMGGLKELIINGETGEIVPSATVEDLKRGIDTFFINDPQQYKSKIVELKKEMSWENFAAHLEDFIFKLKRK